ncbi:MAG TPA: hypothetical protein DCP31_16335 [Cyanobacteria bacterium UBA8543]|nr:hypothetical protein [Cyanobacteria bacterium UBA8543]
MVWTKHPRHFMVLTTFILLEFVTTLGFLTTAQTQAKTSNQILGDRQLKGATFEPRKDQPAPTLTVGGGRRNNNKCPQDRPASEPLTKTNLLNQRLTPILPSPLTSLQLTVSAHPTFLVYIPQTNAKSVEFTLVTQDKDNSEKGIYQTTLALTSTPSIISISLPATAPMLEIGKDYKWIVVMACQTGEPTPEDPFVEGLVRRIQPDSSLSQLDRAKPLDRVALYAKSGSWYDAVATLAALRKDQPNNSEVASAWKDLLQGVGLDAIANAPLKN